MANTPDSEAHSTERLRSFLLGLLLLGTLGTLAELYLLGHYEEWWQRLPVMLLAAALPLIGLCWLYPSARAVRLLRGLLCLFVIAGLLGVYHHYTGNAEFEIEMYPERSGFELVWESLRGATPALAPASMAWLGLIGLVYTFRHPVLFRD